VRGLDYYTQTVFEVTSSSLGAQNALLGGGRYDELFAEMGGPPLSAIGFSIGEDRLVSVLPADPRTARPVFFVVPDSPAHFRYALAVSGDIRACLPEAVVETDLTGRGLQKGLARAALVVSEPSRYAFAASGVWAVLLGGRESESDSVTVKNLGTGLQQTYARKDLAARLGSGSPA
jgi:histidyl-tRNA synthetase